jgi:DNA-binding LacI/PurR family transcriptional regulator
MRDVAREAGVSLATVSYTLNESRQAARITPATKAKVQTAIDRLGYRVDPLGRALQRGRTNQVILLIVTWDLALSHSATAMAISRASIARGFELTVHVADDDSLAADFLRRGAMHHIGGLVVLWDSPAMQESPVLQLAAEGITVIDLLPGSSDPIATVTVDREDAFFRAARHLIDLGHTRIGMICDAHTRSKTSLRKLAGYQGALELAGLSTDDSWIENVDLFGFEGGHRGFQRLAARCPGLTGLLCINDGMALGAIAAARESGRNCPVDLSVVGFGDAAEGRYFAPQLTTFGLSSQRVADAAVDLLSRAQRSAAAQPQSVFVQEELIVRESTGPAPRASSHRPGPTSTKLSGIPKPSRRKDGRREKRPPTPQPMSRRT